MSWFCPVDCSMCWEPRCLAEGCARTGHPVLSACEQCGTLVVQEIGLICTECIGSMRPLRRLPRSNSDRGS
jgi:hypothetical protein